jgi:type IV pilus assembly protein PilF
MTLFKDESESMKLFKNITGLLVLILLLSACVPTSGTKDEDASAARSAAETNTALGRQYMERGQNEVALDKLKRAVAHDKTYAPAHTMLGYLYETIGQIDQAGEEYQLAVRYDPTDGEVNNNYASFLCGQNKGKEAEKYFETAVKDPFYSSPEVAYANAGVCQLQMNDLDKAEASLRKSLEYNAQYAAALLPMAGLYEQKGSYLRARAFLQRFEAANEINPQSLMLGYQIENALGDETASSRYQRDLLDRFPNSREAIQMRGQ